jgi:DNA processing protein
MLIRDGATLVRGVRDILDHLGDPLAMAPELPLDTPTAVSRPSLRTTAVLHEDILSRLAPAPMAEDQLIRSLGAAPTAVAPILVDLELDGKVIRQPGGLLACAV